MAGYHEAEIKRGVLGDASKIREEFEEFWDAHSRAMLIMALVELSDLYGAMEAYLMRYHPYLSMKDVAKMSDSTKKAFEDGTRQKRD
jgi:hypothetical protein